MILWLDSKQLIWNVAFLMAVVTLVILVFQTFFKKGELYRMLIEAVFLSSILFIRE